MPASIRTAAAQRHSLGLTSELFVHDTPLVPGFISYSTLDRAIAARVKAALATLGVEGFLAHEDISVSQVWRDRILMELRRMRVFVPLISAAFASSEWTGHEAGAAVVRDDVLIIPILLDATRPTGFLSAVQGQRLPETFTTEFFAEPLLARFPRNIIPMMISGLAKATSYRSAERLMKPIVSHFGSLTVTEATALAEAAADNGQVWDAADCRLTYLPAFIDANRHQLPEHVLTRLSYQLEFGRWWDGREA